MEETDLGVLNWGRRKWRSSAGVARDVPAMDIDGISGLQVLTRLAAALLELGSRGRE